jgi:hypothetical protein
LFARSYNLLWHQSVFSRDGRARHAQRIAPKPLDGVGLSAVIALKFEEGTPGTNLASNAAGGMVAVERHAVLAAGTGDCQRDVGMSS